MKNIVRAGITAVVLSLGLVAPSAADQPTELARPKPIVIAGGGFPDNGGALQVYYYRYQAYVAAGATFALMGGAAQLALLFSLGLTACASPSGPRLVSIRFRTRAASE